jgi:hypothetical protein
VDAWGVVGGEIGCFDYGDRADVRFRVEPGGSGGYGGGGVLGIASSTSSYGGIFSVSNSVAGTCADAVSSLAALLPAPLCASGSTAAYSQSGLQFVCSGSARDVIDAVGGVAKGVLALPPAPMP